MHELNEFLGLVSHVHCKSFKTGLYVIITFLWKIKAFFCWKKEINEHTENIINIVINQNILISGLQNARYCKNKKMNIGKVN